MQDNLQAQTIRVKQLTFLYHFPTSKVYHHSSSFLKSQSQIQTLNHKEKLQKCIKI